MGNPYMGQAKADVAAAYKPAFKQISRQAKRVKAFDRKQARDEKAYRSWMKTTQNEILARGQAQDAQLAQTVSGFQGQLDQAIGASGASAAGSAAIVGGGGAQAGAWGDFTAAGGPLEKSQADAIRGASAASGIAQIGKIRGGADMARSVAVNNYAFLAAKSAERRQRTADALGKLADARGDLATKAAAERISLAAQYQKDAAEQAQRDAEFAYKQQQDAIQNQLAQDKYNLDVSQFNYGRRKDKRRLQLDRWKAHHGGASGGPNPKDVRGSRNALANAIAYATGMKGLPGKDADGNTTLLHPPYVLGQGRGGKRANATKSWLMSYGNFSPAIAEAAAWYAVYPNKPLPRRLRRALRRTTTGAIGGR